MMRDTDDRKYEEQRMEKRRDRLARQRRKRKKQLMMHCAMVIGIVLVVVVGIPLLVKGIRKLNSTSQTGATVEQLKYIENPPDFSVELLDINEYSRPGTAIDQVNGIVVHWTANPGTTAEQNRNYFEGLAESGETYASSHFVIGLEGEIVQCIPCNEMSYASNDRNVDTVSIECCIPGDDGKFNDATYDSLVQLVTWLMGRYDLSVDDVIRHYDVTGKDCPKYFVDHEDAWLDFKQDLRNYIDANGIAKTDEIN